MLYLREIAKVNTILIAALSAVIVLGATGSALDRKHSAAYRAARQRCNQDYKVQLASANKHKHSERKELEAAIRKAYKECLARLPQ